MQTRFPEFTQPITSDAMQKALFRLMPPGVYNGCEVEANGGEEIIIQPGDVKMPDGVIISEDKVTPLAFAVPPIPTVYTVTIRHTVVNLISGSAAVYAIETGKLLTGQGSLADGVALAYIKHPGAVGVDDSMITPTMRMKLPEIIDEYHVLHDEALINPFPGTVNAGVQATLLIPGADANGGVRYAAVDPGTAGNSTRVQHRQIGLNTALSVSVGPGSDIIVTLATNGTGAITSTANQVLAAILASAPASALVIPSVTGTGGGKAGALAITNLAGGQDASGGNIIVTEVYETLTNVTALQVENSIGAPAQESHLLVSQLFAKSRPPRRLLVTCYAPTGTSLVFSMKGTDGNPVTLTPSTVGPTSGWGTAELVIGSGVFDVDEPWILLTKFQINPGARAKLASIVVSYDPVALI